uniref:Thiaminase-2/PQQC domain-containing protein n=1 Tax=Helicotheca tamesis TaxID=374047 RepID=A0A6U0H951_9STRA|mmetsp:Transcript_5306/g.7289  ORF Transcript_5306/g.7289 Transcript_5306/m.7289 type:complete len:253 (+) Transcript_5306:116-874(+)|eukprot:CAMPEP_0185737238 /NCGR_PEP_ID=MMETSP1171-20130828/29968_1 /TAXON_ID=374046 /ORGANISM="Helicotheca tamensis, Strain CCMP826" /LENGTH=252 /DNA_ID=CAMNT_0028408113 /DNA_START=62 /DNA_END=820 /DNA_ORIENTATION=-
MSSISNEEKEKDELKPYLAMLKQLRLEPFHEETNSRLENHPYITTAIAGELTLAQRRAFCFEQFAIQKSDAKSFEALAKKKTNESKAEKDLFQFLHEGELYAQGLLVNHAKSVDIDIGDDEMNSPEAIITHNGYKITAKGQGYPSYWARLALNNQRGAGAAACAVNFPAWGSMCKNFLESLRKNKAYGYSEGSDSKKALAFIEFFATPIENLDYMAALVMKEEGVKYDDLIDVVRLLQEYEISFWDAIYDAK